MATEGQINDGRNLVCSICQEDVNVPKTLPCLHTFCERCIADYIVNTERKAGHKLSNYSCPVCRTVVSPLDLETEVRTWVDELKHGENPNLMMNVSDNEVDNKIDNYQECHVCKRLNNATRAMNWCRECQEALCNICTKNHGVMKLSINHNVVKIEEAMNRCDFTEDIVENCPVHENKVVEFYCLDHNEICCGLCCTVNHRKCTNVRAVVDIIEDQQVGVDVFKSDLQKFSLSTQNLLESIKEGKSQHENSFKDIETNVRSTVQTMKDILDSLLIVFIKELNLKQDEVEISSDSELRKVEDLLQVISEAENRLERVQKYGTFVQLFVYLNKMRSELGKAIEVVKNGINIKEKKVNVVLNDILVQGLGLDSLGKLEDLMLQRYSVVDFRKTVNKFLSKTTIGHIDTVSVERTKTICLSDFDIHGGTSIDRNHIIVCNHIGKRLHIVDVTSASILRSVSLEHCPKRLAMDNEGRLFISCFGCGVYQTKVKTVQNDFGRLHQTNNTSHTGGICLDDMHIYVVARNEIKKLEVNAGVTFKSCFAVDTDCRDLNGLAVDNKNMRLVYTSKRFHVVCVSLEGKEIFSYNDDQMRKVTSVVVDFNGLIFVGDESGCVHLISEDGKQRKTLINKCEKISKVCDVWLDNDEKRLFVCGNQYVEIYSLEYGWGF